MVEPVVTSMRGWMRYSRRLSPCCIVKEVIRFDVDESLCPTVILHSQLHVQVCWKGVSHVYVSNVVFISLKRCKNNHSANSKGVNPGRSPTYSNVLYWQHGWAFWLVVCKQWRKDLSFWCLPVTNIYFWEINLRSCGVFCQNRTKREKCTVVMRTLLGEVGAPVLVPMLQPLKTFPRGSLKVLYKNVQMSLKRRCKEVTGLESLDAPPVYRYQLCVCSPPLCLCGSLVALFWQAHLAPVGK